MSVLFTQLYSRVYVYMWHSAVVFVFKIQRTPNSVVLPFRLGDEQFFYFFIVVKVHKSKIKIQLENGKRFTALQYSFLM